MCLLAVRFFYRSMHSFCLPEMTEDNLFRSDHTGTAESATPEAHRAWQSQARWVMGGILKPLNLAWGGEEEPPQLLREGTLRAGHGERTEA